MIKRLAGTTCPLDQLLILVFGSRPKCAVVFETISPVVISSGDSLRLIDVPEIEDGLYAHQLYELRDRVTISANYKSIYGKKFDLPVTSF